MYNTSFASATARLAQSAERKALNLVVVGSSPTVGVYQKVAFQSCCAHWRAGVRSSLVQACLDSAQPGASKLAPCIVSHLNHHSNHNNHNSHHSNHPNNHHSNNLHAVVVFFCVCVFLVVLG